MRDTPAMTTSSRPSATRLHIPVLLFARYAELLGTPRLELELPIGCTVGAALAVLREQPGAEALPAQLLVARNLERVGLEARLALGDELAILPPMAGG